MSDPCASATGGGSHARLFFALWPGEPTRDELQACQQSWRWPRAARLTLREHLHVTLQFMGQIPRSQVPALLEAANVPVRPFDLLLDTAGIWRSGVAWLRPSSPPAELLALHGRLGDVLQQLGCEADRRAFEPHLTLARRATGAEPPAHPGVRWRVDGYVLVESRLLATPEYTVLRSYGQP